MECTLSRFVGDSMLCDALDSMEGRDTMQRDINRLEEWTHVDPMKLNNVKCVALYPGQGHSKYQYRLQDERVASNLVEEDSEIWVHENLDMRWQCVFAAQKASCILGCIKERTRFPSFASL